MGRRISKYEAYAQRRHAERVKLVLRRIVETAPRNSEVHGFALELANLIGQSIPCPRCGGRGMHSKHIACYHTAHDAYVNGCNEIVECRRCGCVGYLLKPQQQSAQAGVVSDE